MQCMGPLAPQLIPASILPRKERMTMAGACRAHPCGSIHRGYWEGQDAHIHPHSHISVNLYRFTYFGVLRTNGCSSHSPVFQGFGEEHLADSGHDGLILFVILE